jgi:branched-chain amino acid transport system substrate-binding protein
MKKARKDSASNKASPNQAPSKRQGRRDFLIKTGGILASTAFGAVPLRGWAADPVNIGAL